MANTNPLLFVFERTEIRSINPAETHDWASLADGALNMNLSMGTKGRFGQNAAILGLTGEQRAGDYQLWRRPINISGTLSNPNYAALKDMILGAIR